MRLQNYNNNFRKKKKEKVLKILKKTNNKVFRKIFN